MGPFLPWLLEQVGIRAAFGFFATMSLLLLELIRRTLAVMKEQSPETLEPRVRVE